MYGRPRYTLRDVRIDILDHPGAKYGDGMLALVGVKSFRPRAVWLLYQREVCGQIRLTHSFV